MTSVETTVDVGVLAAGLAQRAMMGRRPWTFGLLHDWTPGLDGEQRHAVFEALPRDCQDACWRALHREWRDRRRGE